MKRLLLAALMMVGATGMARAEPLTVLLDWFVNPDHGPLIVAQELGYFAERDLEVELVPPADPSAPPRLVAAGQADLAVSYQPQLYLQVAEGLPLARVGTLVDSPLNSLVVLADGPVQSIADLKGRKVGFSVGGMEDALLGTMLETHGLTLEDVELVNVNFSLSPSLMSGQVDAVIGAFRNFELNQMDIEGRPGRAFLPEEEGVPTYDELILVARTDSLDDARVPRFLDAIAAATKFIVDDPDAGWALFIDGRPDLDDELNRRAWRDTVPKFPADPVALPDDRYADFGAFLVERGMIETAPAVEEIAVEVR